VRLAGEGVYLTSDEYKGKKEVVRGAESFLVSPGDFERRDTSAGFTIQSSGTRNTPVRTFSSLEWRTLHIMQFAIFFSAHDLFSCAHALYEPMVTGRVIFALINAKLGITTERWFAIRVPVDSWREGKYRHLTTYPTVIMGKWFGPGIAKPEFLDMGDIGPIVEWVLEKRREGKNCCITTVFSNAVRIARGALAMGVSLEGTKFQASGEPLTESKRRVIEETGARVAPRYGPGGGNGAALGCGNPSFIDEMHVPQNVLTFVEHLRPLDHSDPPIYPLLVTTLHPAAPRLLLNVENGDYVTMKNRDCGCPLQRVGFTQHLHTIRSFEKFTTEGRNYSTADLFGLLESTIPSEFGGGPGDYQLVEEEDDNAQTRLTLLVHPNVGEVNKERLLTVLQEGLTNASTDRAGVRIWQEAGTLRVRRQVPYSSQRGKTLPLHIRH